MPFYFLFGDIKKSIVLFPMSSPYITALKRIKKHIQKICMQLHCSTINTSFCFDS